MASIIRLKWRNYQKQRGGACCSKYIFQPGFDWELFNFCFNTCPVLNLSNEIEKAVFEEKALGISEHHRKIFSNRNDGFIKNEEAYIEF